jgi:hypothetical protein
MKLGEVLRKVDQLRPNAFTDAEKIDMMNTVEGRVYTDIMSKAEDGLNWTFIPFKEGEEERELVVPTPFTDLYFWYMASMIDLYNGDSGRYNDSVVMYNKAWDEYAAYYRENNKPKQTNLHGMIQHGWGW